MKSAKDFPDNHPIKRIFRTFTERGLAQASVRDPDLLFYLANLLVEFLWMENLYGMRDADGRRLPAKRALSSRKRGSGTFG